ncbi:MAG: hypothetical protein KDC98_21850, partial [Planctomycetes bacterium]|nr:hypothetical protein [Planctomycetota bacterium]
MSFVSANVARRERVATARGEEAWSSSQLVILLLITLVAAGLRLWQLEVWSVSAAEAQVWQRATTVAPHGFGLADRVLRLLFDHDLLPVHGEGWLRLPFAFAGLVAVPLLALVGAAFVGRGAALLAAGLLAIHPWHVEQSQSATGAGPALTFGLGAFGLAWIGSGRRRLLPWLLAMLGVVAAGTCHLHGWLLGYVLVACWRLDGLAGAGRRRRLAFSIGAALVLAATLGALLAARSQPGYGGDPVALALPLDFAVTASLPLVVAALASALAWPGEARPRRCLVVATVLPVLVATAVGVGVEPVEP